jgi:alpha-beta hydrolase superfamily lysophospholipase
MTTEAEPFLIETFAASDGYEMRFRRYPAQGKPRGQVVAIHGIQSHGGWYVGSCSHLARAGWEVLFLDRRGSGLNEKARGDTPGYRRLVADLDEFVAAACESPPFLLAISWGAKLALGLEYLAPRRTKGLVLVTPGLCPRVRVPFLEKVQIGLARLFAPGTLFPIPLSDPHLFTSTPAWLEFLRNDPLSLHQATARLLFASRLLDRLMRKAHARVRVPVLLLLGGRDRIIDNEPTKEYVKLFPTYDSQVIEYPSASHTLEFEPDPLPYYRAVERWLEMHNALA